MTDTDADDAVSAWGDDVQDPRGAIAFNAKLPTGDESVRCLVCGSELQYITHSHMASHPHGPRTIEKYKREVADVLDVEEDEVPVVSADLSNRLAEQTRAAWEDGNYDHFRISP